MRNLLAQRRVVAKGKPGLWRRLGPGMPSDTPDQEEHNEHSCQRQAASSATIPEYSRGLAVPLQKLHPSVSSGLSFTLVPQSTFLSGIKAALGSRVDPIFTDYGACTGIPLTSPGGLVTLARRHERVRDVRRGHTLKAECSTSSSMTTGPRGLHAPRLSPWSEAACIM